MAKKSRIIDKDCVYSQRIHSVFSSRIMELMDILDTNGRQLSLHAGIPHSSIIAWMDGRQAPSAASLLKLATAYDVSIDWLLGRTDVRRVASRK